MLVLRRWCLNLLGALIFFFFVSSSLFFFFFFILAAQTFSAASTSYVLERLQRMALLRPQDPIGSVEAIAQMHMDRSIQAYGFKKISPCLLYLFIFIHSISFCATCHQVRYKTNILASKLLYTTKHNSQKIGQMRFYKRYALCETPAYMQL